MAVFEGAKVWEGKTGHVLCTPKIEGERVPVLSWSPMSYIIIIGRSRAQH